MYPLYLGFRARPETLENKLARHKINGIEPTLRNTLLRDIVRIEKLFLIVRDTTRNFKTTPLLIFLFFFFLILFRSDFPLHFHPHIRGYKKPRDPCGLPSICLTHCADLVVDFDSNKHSLPNAVGPRDISADLGVTPRPGDVGFWPRSLLSLRWILPCPVSCLLLRFDGHLRVLFGGWTCPGNSRKVGIP